MVRLICLAALAMLLGMAPVSAMTFRLVKTDAGVRVVKASGDIVVGDDRGLRKALNLATRDKHGTKELLLDSAGGVVIAALKMAEVMDQVGVTTIVPKGAFCASACASVLFVSGKYRTIEKGGALVIHSCYDERNGRPIAYCNAVISQHAADEGLSGEAMMALQQAAGTDSAFLFDRESAACFGLTRQPGAKASTSAPCVTAAQKGSKRR